MVNVVCVNWGTKYSREYTQRLYNMVKRNTTKDFKFYVLTDQTSLYYGDIIPIELDGGFTGWWNKLQMFKPGILPKGEYLYFDLDVVIVDNIDCFFEHPSFGIIRDFIRPDNGILPGKEYNSSAMRFNTDLSSIWEYYIQNNIKFHDMQKQVSFFGDQNVVSSYVNYYPNILNCFPDEWLWSYKKGVERGKHAGDRSQMFGRSIPEGGKVCVFHGNPNPTEVSDKWVKKNYL
jgi:hypothetical protein|tara:strand:- start:510 stop:1205 length:696 start_codon:yes stop_codon:yes gene_type:complete